MRKLLKVLFAALSLTVLFVSCELLLGSDEDKKEEGDGSSYAGGDISDYQQTRTFRAQSISPSGWYDVPATIRAAGTRCVVYVEDASLDDVSTSLAQSIAREFDLNIYGKMRSSFGIESDMDGNGVVVLLLLDIVDGYSGSGGYVAGYFDSTHMFTTDTFANSNEAEMLFMDINPATAGSKDFYGTLAHEFQHLINYANTFDGVSSQDTWINEGLSAGAEYVYSGKQVQSRISHYNNDPYDSLLNGNNFFVWSNDAYVLDEYATVYLFFQWLRIHALNGTGIYKQILNSSYKDYRAVTGAAESSINGSFSSWEVLLRTWMGANLMCRSSGYFGYKGQIEVGANGYLNSGSVEVNLYPGEGIFSLTEGGGYVPPGGSDANIRYVGFNTATGAADPTGSTYSGNVALVFNANSLRTGGVETGYVANVASATVESSTVFRSIASDYVPPSSYPISITLQPGGGLHPDSHRPGPAKFGERLER